MYQPAGQQYGYRHPAMAQNQPAAAPAATPTPAVAVTAPDTMGTVKKAATTLITLGVLGSAAYVGVKTGMSSKNKTMQALGYVGGVGAGLLGLAALSGFVAPKQVTTTLLLPFNLPSAA
jgi:hypothetical protein